MGLYLQFSGWIGEATTAASPRSPVAPPVVTRTTAGTASQSWQPTRSLLRHSICTAGKVYQCRQLTSVWREFVRFRRASERKPAVDFTMRGKSIRILIWSCWSSSSKFGNDWEIQSNKFLRDSVALYDEQLGGHVESGKAKLELKNRRGENSQEKLACDIVDLVTYTCGLETYFSANVLSSRSTYIEVEAEKIRALNPSFVEKTPNKINLDGVESTIKILLDHCERQEQELKALRIYVLNVEKICVDEVTEIKNKLNKSDIVANELNHVQVSNTGDDTEFPSLPSAQHAHPSPTTGDSAHSPCQSRRSASQSAGSDLPPTGHNASFLSVVRMRRKMEVLPT